MLFLFLNAQAPTGYYDGTAGLSGAALKNKLSSIISAGHQDRGYDNLYNGYQTTDTDSYYESDGTVLDMYSERPLVADPYNFNHSSADQCGNYSAEGDCYNREHIIPQSFFSEGRPMRHDIHFVVPSDGKVNGMRSNYPFGVVASPKWTSDNGSKLGVNTSAGYSGTVFEPIDEFKGDIARMVLYFVTRYESRLSGFSTGNMLGGSAFPGLQNWELQVLLNWNKTDKVSDRERNRNNAAYIYQGNRNPFIDDESFADKIWGSVNSTDTTPPSVPTNLAVTSTSSNSITLSWNASTDNVSISGYEVYLNGVFQFTVSGTSATVSGLNASTTYNFNVVAKDSSGNTSTQSNTAIGTTAAGTAGGTPTTCGTENFENIPASSSNYATRTWTNNGITWTAVDARTDQTISGSKAITIEDGSLSSTTVSGGIGSLTVTTEMEFTGVPGTFNLYINGDMMGQIPYSSTATTTTIPNINIEGNITISITDNSATGTGTRGRVSFDNLSWTCYTTLATQDHKMQKNSLRITPNPVRNSEINILGLQTTGKAEIYNMNGQLIQTAEKISKNSNKILLKNLPKGVYILKAENKSVKFIVD